MHEWAELLKAIGALAWPIVVFVVAFLYRSEVRQLVGRLKRGRILGQEIELETSLKQLEQTAAVAASEVPALPPSAVQLDPTQDASNTTSPGGTVQEILDAETRILSEASRSPKLALISLASQLEREVHHLMA